MNPNILSRSQQNKATMNQNISYGGTQCFITHIHIEQILDSVGITRGAPVA